MRDRVSRHEAAHALVMLATGCTVRLVTVEPKGDALGHTQMDLPSVNGAHDGDGTLSGWTAACALVLATAHAIAGPLADEIGGRQPDGQREGDDAVTMVENLTGVWCGLWLPVLREAVRAYLTRHWDLVERVARALEQRRTLGDAELRTLVGEVPRFDLNPVMATIAHHIRHARAGVDVR